MDGSRRKRRTRPTREVSSSRTRGPVRVTPQDARRTTVGASTTAPSHRVSPPTVTTTSTGPIRPESASRRRKTSELLDEEEALANQPTTSWGVPAGGVRKPPKTTSEDDYEDDEYDDDFEDDFEDEEENSEDEKKPNAKEELDALVSSAPIVASQQRRPVAKKWDGDVVDEAGEEVDHSARVLLPSHDASVGVKKPILVGTARRERAERVLGLHKARILSTESHVCFSLPPLNRRERYAAGLLAGSVHQTGSQTGEGGASKHSQTERVDFTDASTQYPEDLRAGQSARALKLEEYGLVWGVDASSKMQSIAKGLARVAPAIEALLGPHPTTAKLTSTTTSSSSGRQFLLDKDIRPTCSCSWRDGTAIGAEFRSTYSGAVLLIQDNAIRAILHCASPITSVATAGQRCVLFFVYFEGELDKDDTPLKYIL